MIFPFLGKNILYFLKTFGLTSKPSQYLFLFRSIAFFFFFFLCWAFSALYIFFSIVRFLHARLFYQKFFGGMGS